MCNLASGPVDMHATTPNCFSADVIGGPRPVSTIVLSEACQSCKATVYPPLLRSCCGTTSCSMSAPSSASCAPSHCSPRRCRLAARLRAALLAARRAAQVEAVDSTLLQARGGQAEEAAVAARLYMYSAGRPSLGQLTEEVVAGFQRVLSLN